MSLSKIDVFRPAQTKTKSATFERKKSSEGQSDDQRTMREYQCSQTIGLVYQIEFINEMSQYQVNSQLTSFVNTPIVLKDKRHLSCAVMLAGFNNQVKMEEIKHKGYIAHLNSKQDTKQMLSSIVKQLISNKPDTELDQEAEPVAELIIDSEEEEDNVDEDELNVDEDGQMDFTKLLKPDASSKKSLTHLYDLQHLVNWYPTVCKNKRKPNLILTFNQYEFFDKSSMNDLIIHLQYYIQKIPIIMVIALSTSMDSLFKSLPSNTISMLDVKKFYMTKNSDTMNSIIDEIFLERVGGFKISDTVLRGILDSFTGYNQSIPRVMDTIKYAIMDHFYGNPLSLLTNIDQNDEDNISDLIDDDILLQAQLLPSFQKEMESIAEFNPSHVHGILTDKKKLRDEIVQYTLALDTYHHRFLVGIKVMLELQDMFTIKKDLKNIYLIALEGNLIDNDVIRQQLMLLKKFEIGKMIRFLTAAKNAIDKIDDPDALCTDDANAIQEFLVGILTFQDSDDNGSGDEGVDENEALDYVLKYGKRMQRVEESEIVKKRTSHVSMHMKPVDFDALIDVKHSIKTYLGYCQNIGVWFTAFFKEACKNYRTQPLYQVVYYSNAAKIRKALTPQPRAAIQCALQFPSHYLRLEDRNPMSDMNPDTSILYSLHLECGKLINLFDLLESFKTCVTGDDNIIFARFMKGVAELERAGFVKSTNRKTDHVTRLTWGEM